MGARDIADRVDHRQDDQSEGQGHADVRDRAARHIVDDNGPGAGKDEAERAEDFGTVFLLTLRLRVDHRMAPGCQFRVFDRTGAGSVINARKGANCRLAGRKSACLTAGRTGFIL